ncbi:MAG: glycosyltransferase [bacterium]
MKICLINNLYPPYHRGGGAEQITQIMKQGLEEMNHKVIVITCKPYFIKFDKQPDVYHISSLYPNLNKIPKYLRLFWHIFHLIGLYKSIKINNIINKEKCDLVVSHNLEGLNYLTPRFIKPKHIHIIHDIQLLHPSGLMYYGHENIINTFYAKIYQAICRSCFKKTDLIISPSAWLLKLHQKHGLFNKKTLIMRNPQLNVQTKNKENNAQFTFLSVGQIEEHKGVPLLIKAFSKLKKTHNLDCKLVVIGGGSKLEELKNNDCEFLGKMTNQKVNELMQKADCLIVPSLCYENSPTIIFEAMNNNLPVMASKIGGIPEILDYNPYLLFEPDNLDKLSVKMYWAVTNPEKLKKEFEQVRQKIKPISVKEYFEKIKKELIN